MPAIGLERTFSLFAAFRIRTVAGIASALLAMTSAKAQPSILNYRGEISAGGKLFSGTGFFTFAIVDARGVILWSSGEFPLVGKTNLPASVMRVPVVNGSYAVRLGDTRQGMMPLDGNVLREAPAPRLRIWFNDGQRGWQVADNGVLLGTAEGRANAPAAPPASDAVMAELRELRARVEKLSAAPRRPAEATPTTVTVPTGNSPSLGRADAPLVLVEFTDFQCGFCKRFHDTTMHEVIRNFVDTGKLRLVSRSLPLAFHTNAPAAALAALCAHEQGQFWPMRDKLFSNIAALTQSNFVRYAEQLQLNVPAFQRCLDARTYSSQIERDSADAAGANITGTPTFVLGRATGTNVTGQLMVGARPYPQFAAEINKMLEATR